jgi:hypothetical protein
MLAVVLHFFLSVPSTKTKIMTFLGNDSLRHPTKNCPKTPISLQAVFCHLLQTVLEICDLFSILTFIIFIMYLVFTIIYLNKYFIISSCNQHVSLWGRSLVQ